MSVTSVARAARLAADRRRVWRQTAILLQNRPEEQKKPDAPGRSTKEKGGV